LLKRRGAEMNVWEFELRPTKAQVKVDSFWRDLKCTALEVAMARLGQYENTSGRWWIG
jgi:hypothetical protein